MRYYITIGVSLLLDHLEDSGQHLSYITGYHTAWRVSLALMIGCQAMNVDA